jgi:hypothetical protein
MKRPGARLKRPCPAADPDAVDQGKQAGEEVKKGPVIMMDRTRLHRRGTMSMRKRRLTACALGLALLLVFGTHTLSWAMPTWVEGTVTRTPWLDTYRYIEVEGKIYTVMTTVRMGLRYEDRPGALTERVLTLQDIRRGDKAMMRVEGRRVYQILIYR